jgi:chromosome segregation ATPase
MGKSEAAAQEEVFLVIDGGLSEETRSNPNGESSAMEREGFWAHWRRVVSERLVRSLLSQRAELLQNQQTAAAQVHELHQRLNSAQDKLVHRLRQYQARIAELERQLAIRDEENAVLARNLAFIEQRQKDSKPRRSRTRAGVDLTADLFGES